MVDSSRSLLVGVNDLENLIAVDAETLRPRRGALDIAAVCGAAPITDGSIAMLYEYSANFERTHWRVVDVNTGEVGLGGDLNVFAMAAYASRDGSTVADGACTGEIVIVGVSTGEEQRPTTSLGAPVLWLKYSDDGERATPSVP